MTQDERDSARSSDDPTGSGEFAAAYWEHRYRTGEPTSRHDPSPSLVDEAGALPPGRALDAGCGRGADAVWLAGAGWEVTAVDVSAAAIGSGREAALAAGPGVAGRITWACADLTGWAPSGPPYDLVTSHYVHVPGPAEDLFRRLASWVAPGGTLLVVGHAAGHGEAHGQGGAQGHGEAPGHGGAHGHGEAHAHPPGAQLRVEQVTAGLPEGEWEVLVAEPRTHTVRRPGGGGEVRLSDVVVRARRAPARTRVRPGPAAD